LVLRIIAYTLSSTKLELRAKQFLPDNEGGRGKGGGMGKGGEMIQTLHANMNKRKKLN
jgi:hypothetical protein